MRPKRCRYCPDRFTPDPCSYRPSPSGKGRRSAQIACANPTCQRQRHRDACLRWHVDNPTYDDNRPPPKREPGYWSTYRADHPDKAKRNREKQRERDAQRKNLATRDAIPLFSLGKARRLINLATRDAIRTPPLRVSEEIVRQMARANRLATRDVIALQKKIEHNRGHETSATA